MLIRSILLSFFLLALTLAFANAHAEQFVPKPMAKPNLEQQKQDFQNYLSEYKARAEQAGIDRQLMDRILAGQKPDSTIIRLDRTQPGSKGGKKTTIEEYVAKVVTSSRIKIGNALIEENRALLDEISRKYGVEKEFIVALWGLETGYGTNTGGFHVINALATLAYDGRRRELFEKELLNAFKIIQDGHVREDNMLGSWAGAMGQCQFMPTSFFRYAVDYNGDGKRDIWNTKADVFASIANYLATVGWGKTHAIKEKALLDWNKSDYFTSSVFKLARELGYDDNKKD